MNEPDVPTEAEWLAYLEGPTSDNADTSQAPIDARLEPAMAALRAAVRNTGVEVGDLEIDTRDGEVEALARLVQERLDARETIVTRALRRRDEERRSALIYEVRQISERLAKVVRQLEKVNW